VTLDPYAPPASSLDAGPGPEISRRTGWKVYAVLMIVLSIAGVGKTVVDGQLTILSLANNGPPALWTMGLVGYAFRLRLLARPFWMIAAVAAPIWDVVWNVATNHLRHPYLVFLATLLIVGAQYVALFRYGYRSNDLWRRPEG
jgi:hypothetical protein